jgi:hypothetical protein
MPTISDLFKSQVKEIYGKSEKIRIDSRGIINAPRGAALLGSSPDALSSLIGNQLGGALGGSANRPTDTIFKQPKGFFTKPISLLAPTEALLKDSVKEGTSYFVKQSPAPNSVIAASKSTSETIGGAALSAVNKYGSANGLKALANSLKKNSEGKNEYGAKYNKTTLDGKTYVKEDVLFSKYYEETKIHPETKLPMFDAETNKYAKQLVKREGKYQNSWDDSTNQINNLESFDSQQKFNESKYNSRFQNQIWVAFKKYGNKEVIPFVGSVSGISEDVTPEWSNFKYLGSPFKINRYQGVERSVKFNLKLYYHTKKERDTMMKKINYLKSLAFPYEKISEMKYGGDTQTSQYAFSPQLFYFTIGDMYESVLSHLESISFNVEDNVSWPNFEPNGLADDNTAPSDAILYPSVIDVSLSMKIIEQNLHSADTATKTYKYNFDGNNTDAIFESIEDQGPAQQSTAQLNALKGKGPVMV